MTFMFGGSAARRHRMLRGEQAFEWQSDWRTGKPAFRDMTWNFEEPDQYPELVAAQKPGMMASKSEKAFHAAVASGDPAAMLAVAGQHPGYQVVADTIAGLLMLETDLDRGVERLMGAVAAADDVGKDRFVRKYLPEAGLSVTIAAGVMVHLPLQRNSIALLVAELHQARDDLAQAVGVLESVEATSHVRLSLAELLFEQGQFDRVLSVSQGVINDDDVTALTLAYRGRALAELGRDEEAVGALARALEYPNRAESVKAIALVGRGMIHQKRGDHLLAQNDFTQALVEVPDDEEAVRHIQELIHGDSSGG